MTDQTTNPSEAAASSPLPDERTLQHIAESRLGYYPEPVQAMAREILRMRRDCTPTAEVEQMRAELTSLRQAVGLMTTAKPDMQVDVRDPIGMAQQVVAMVGELRRDGSKALGAAHEQRKRAIGAESDRDAWKHKADSLGGDLNRIRALLPKTSDEQTTFDAVKAELNRLRNESKRDRAEKQQALLDQIAQLLPGKGDLLGRVQKGAALAKIGAEAINDGWRERFMRLRDSIKVQLAWCSTPSGTPHPGMLAEHRVLSCALKNAEAMLREASGDLASLPSLPAKEGPLPGSFCGTNQPEMPPLKADAPCGYKPASHRDDFDNAPNFGGKFAPATGQPRTEAPLAADGSGTVVELGEAFRTAMINASVLTMADILPGESIEAAKLRHLREAVAELAEVVERIGSR